jgi:hypothetical protein
MPAAMLHPALQAASAELRHRVMRTAGGHPSPHTWHNGHVDAYRVAVLHKLQEHLNIVEELRHDDIAARIHLAWYDKQCCLLRL